MPKLYRCLVVLIVGYLPMIAFGQPASVLLVPEGGTPAAYSSITTAYAAIPFGSVRSYIIELLPTYKGTDPAEVYPIRLTNKNLQADQNIVIRPSANNPHAVIQPPAGVKAVLHLDGAQNVVIEGRPGGEPTAAEGYLKIVQQTTAANAGEIIRNLELSNGAKHNIIQYVQLVSPLNASANEMVNVVLNGDQKPVENNTIAHCTLIGGTKGLWERSATVNQSNLHNIIINNSFKNCSGKAIHIATQQGGIISHNQVSFDGASQSTSLAGIVVEGHAANVGVVSNTIHLATSTTAVSHLHGIFHQAKGNNEVIRGNNIITLSAPGAIEVEGIKVMHQQGFAFYTIHENRISSLKTNAAGLVNGMVIQAGQQAEFNIYNNFVSIADQNAASPGINGIALMTATNSKVNCYFNSIFIAGKSDLSIQHAAALKAIIAAGVECRQKNNLLIVRRNFATAFVLEGDRSSTQMDYNNYHSEGQASGSYAVALKGGTGPGIFFTQQDQTAYKAQVFPLDQNTTFLPVEFISSTDLHLATASVNNQDLKGIPVTGITTDIDQNLRSDTKPTKGADEPGGPVPVQLFAFTGVSKGAFNRLTWSTASESNNRGFELQRSGDGSRFDPVGFIPSQSDNGSSSAILNYSFDDLRPFTTTTYYRLKQMDKDGRSLYSNIIAIKGKGVNHITISNLYPNPVINYFTTVVATAKPATILFWITDMTGKTYQMENIRIKAGDNIIPVDASKYGKGIYLLRVINQHTLEMASLQFLK